MLIIFGSLIVVIIAALLGRYFYNNMYYDKNTMSKVTKAGFVEKIITLEDGSVINYGEGPNNGPALLLIHGQLVEWEDYVRVLPQLAKKFHVYAVDCYGHGQSSNKASLYSCNANGEALRWFIKNVIREKCFVSGHSSGGVLTSWLAANASENVKGIVLEDPPLFRVTPQEMQQDKGCFAWKDTFVPIHNFLKQDKKTDYVVYYLKNGYLTTMFGGLKDSIVRSAEAYRKQHLGEPLKISWVPYAWIRGLYYIDDYDLEFGETFYDGSWMKGIDQEAMLKKISCPTIYLKACTNYGKDGVLYAANSEEDAKKVQSLIATCERIDIKSGHDIHFEHPDKFIDVCEKLLK